MDDFCGLTPQEFEEVCKAYHNQREADYRNDWERMRLLATICIQPHIKNKITPHKLIPFAWDNQKKRTNRGDSMTAEERQKRMSEMIAKLGEKY